jgi:large subunit ribosomal protein L31e
MAEEKTNKIERIYTIPLRRHLLMVPIYRRTGRAIKTIKKFVAKHMKIEDRDVSKVKLDVQFNNDIWFKGRTNPPTKVKVKVTKENDIVKVTFVDTPQHVKYLQAKLDKRDQRAQEGKPVEQKPEVKEEKTEEQKKDENEKAKATAVLHEKEAKQDANAQKHASKIKEPKIQRMALKK